MHTGKLVEYGALTHIRAARKGNNAGAHKLTSICSASPFLRATVPPFAAKSIGEPNEDAHILRTLSPLQKPISLSRRENAASKFNDDITPL